MEQHKSLQTSMIRRMSSPARRAGVPAAILSAAVLLLAACGGGDADTGAPPAGGGGNGAMTVSIAEPASGATVSSPLNVKVNSSVELGPTDSGKHHVHIFLDGNDSDYLLVESTSGQLTDKPQLTPGSHTLHVSLRNADHSPAGAETQIPITVGAGGGAPAPASTPPDDGGEGPYGY